MDSEARTPPVTRSPRNRRSPRAFLVGSRCRLLQQRSAVSCSMAPLPARAGHEVDRVKSRFPAQIPKLLIGNRRGVVFARANQWAIDELKEFNYAPYPSDVGTFPYRPPVRCSLL